jgi:hypothetical protein
MAVVGLMAWVAGVVPWPACAAGTRKIAVVLPSAPSPVERFAAEELARCLGKATGWQATVREGSSDAQATVRFWVGMAEPARLRTAGFPMAAFGKRLDTLVADGICILGDGKDVVLVGKAPRGALNAVYHFLESRVGFRWPEPGEEFVPDVKELKFDDLEIVSNPAFPYRGIAIHGQCGDAFFATLVDWLAKNRLNGFQVFCGHYNRLRPKALPEIMKRGLLPNIGGHSRGYFFPADKHFKEHPEYFALVKGRRQAHTQLCYANLTSVPEYAASVVKYVQAQPEIGMVGLWPEDGFGFCECDACKSKSPTDGILNYVNALATEIGKALPELKCEFLSYIHYTAPPQTVNPVPNLIPTYCEYWARNQFHPITEDRHQNKKCREDLAGWIAASRETTVFSYYGDDCIKRFLYNPVMDVIVADFRHYLRIGLKGHFLLMTNPESWWSNAPHLFAYAKVAWDPAGDLTQIETDYYDSLYGPASPAMREHARACRALFELKTAQGPVGEDVLFGFSFGRYAPEKDVETRRQLAAAMTRIRDALRLAKNTKPRPVVAMKIAKLESAADYVEGVFMSSYLARQAAASDSNEAREQALDWIEKSLLLDVLATDDANGYRNANGSLCRNATAITGLAGNSIQVAEGFGYGAFAEEGAVCRLNGTDVVASLPGRLRGSVLVRTHGTPGRAPRSINLSLPKGVLVWVAAEPALAPEWLTAAGFIPTKETVGVSTPAGEKALAVYRREVTAAATLSLQPVLPKGAKPKDMPLWLAFVTPPREWPAIPPSPVGTGHLGFLKSGTWQQLRFPVPQGSGGTFGCRLGNVVAYGGGGKSYRLLVRADSATGPVVYEGPVIAQADEWNLSNAGPFALDGVLTAAHRTRGYIDVFVCGVVEGDGWTIYRHAPGGRRIVAVETPFRTTLDAADNPNP